MNAARSRIYVGRLTHTRPSLSHSFAYRTFMLSLDLADLPRLARSSALFGYNRFRPCAIWDRDYLHPDDRPIDEKLRLLLRAAGCDAGVRRIVMLTVPRVAHVVFNPLTLFWCVGEDNQTRAIVAEVRNTYREAHAYVLHQDQERPSTGRWDRCYRFDKRFFVSPFNGVEGWYELRVTRPNERLEIGLDLMTDAGPLVRTTIALRAVDLETRALARTLVRYPLSAALTLPRITWQALVLRYRKELSPRLKPTPTSPMTLRRRAGDGRAHAHGRRPRRDSEPLIALATVVTPAIGTVLAVGLAASGVAVPSMGELILTMGLYSVTLMGITVGFHRCFAHRAFHAPDGVRFLLGVAGSMAAQGPLLFWVAEHREHHQHSDTAGDPHSPYVRGADPLEGWRGFWHAHVGWMLQRQSAAWQTHAPDVLRDRTAAFVSRWYPAWVLLGLALPAGLAGAWYGTWTHAALGLLWGGLVRVCLAHHATWSVNSFAHLFGRRPFRTADTSRNNTLVSLLTFGEGWHNNHHAFPSSARQGLAWWEIDPSYAGIRLLGLLGLATQIKLADPLHVARRRVSNGSTPEAPDGGAGR